jgi:transcriptional regulator
MYNPAHFEEARPEQLQALIRQHPLCTLVTLTSKGMVANQIPLLLRQGPEHGELGTLVGHVARANPVWKETDLSQPVLAIFQGPQHYISPGWYATKQEHGKVVPTWNYVVVQVHGLLQVHDDAAWVRAQVQALTAQQESAMPAPWAVDDAPRDYTDSMLRAVVGISLPIARWSGKWKVSQNQPPVNQESLVAALGARDAQGAAMAALVQQQRKPQG